MPGQSRHLVIALSLILSGVTELVAKEKVIIVYPGVMKTIPGPKKPAATTRRRNPRVGTRKTESRLSGVSISAGTPNCTSRSLARVTATVRRSSWCTGHR